MSDYVEIIVRRGNNYDEKSIRVPIAAILYMQENGPMKLIWDMWRSLDKETEKSSEEKI